MLRLNLLLVVVTTMLVGGGCSETDDAIDETPTALPTATTTLPTTTTTTAVPGIVPTPQQLVGMWKTSDGYEVLYEDGTFGWGQTPDTALTDPLDWGEYALERGIFTYVTNPEAEYCTRDNGADPPVREGIVGQYEISISQDGNELFRTLIDDGCGNRPRDVVPSITRYTEEG